MSEQTQRLCSYAARLLGREVVAGERISLTSGQLARLIAWAEAERITLHPDNTDRHRFVLNAVDGSAHADPVRPAAGQLPAAGAADAERVPVSVGVDLQLIDEVIPPFTDPKAVPELRGLFTLRELSYAQCRANPRETLAGLFAAKEAIRKADPQYLDVPFPEIEVLPDPQGKPVFAGMSLSISHSGSYAMAAAAKAAPAPASTAPLGREDVPASVATARPEAARGGPRARVRAGLYAAYQAILLCGALSFIVLAAERIFGVSVF